MLMMIQRTTEQLANEGRGGWTTTNVAVLDINEVQKPVAAILHRNVPNASVTIYNGLSGKDACRWTYKQVAE